MNYSMQRSADLLGAMANAKRLEILLLLLEGEKTVGELTALVKLSQSAVSQHMEKLRRGELVNTRRDAQKVFYSCNHGAVTLIIDALVSEGVMANTAIDKIRFRSV